MIWSPAGSPSSGARPQGTDSAALPARLDGIVHRSARYIAIGSSARSPMGKAVVGVAGDTRTSAWQNAASKSREISVRADDPMAMYLADLCTIPSNLAGNAALS